MMNQKKEKKRKKEREEDIFENYQIYLNVIF